MPLTTPEKFFALVQSYERANHGHTTDEVKFAGITVAVRAIQQDCDTKREAELAFDDLFMRAKAGLLDTYTHYGRKTEIQSYPRVDEADQPAFIKKLISEGS